MRRRRQGVRTADGREESASAVDSSSGVDDGREGGRKKEKHRRDAFSRGEGALLEALVEAWRGLAGCLGRRTRQWSASSILGDPERFSPQPILEKVFGPVTRSSNRLHWLLSSLH